MNERPTLQTIIFDLDGVLVDSEPLHAAALRVILRDLGVNAKDVEEAVVESLGSPFADHMSELSKNLGLTKSMQECEERYNEAFLSVLQEQGVEPSRGTNWLLKELRSRRCRIAVASSSVHQLVSALLAAIGHSNTFERVVSGDMVTRGKPDPEIFVKTAGLLGVRASSCAVVEDSPRGLEAARRASMIAIGVVTPLVPRSLLTSADFVIDSLARFPLQRVISDGDRESDEDISPGRHTSVEWN